MLFVMIIMSKSSYPGGGRFAGTGASESAHRRGVGG
jgi:hypothetical protein